MQEIIKKTIIARLAFDNPLHIIKNGRIFADTNH